jgi:hypothetical protein
MSQLSISSSLRIPKVSTYLAGHADSERILDNRFNVCPVTNLQDVYGRDVSANSLNILSAPGCFSADARIAVENVVSRPSYHHYLAIGALDEDAADLYGFDPNTDHQFGTCRSGQDPMLGHMGRPEAFGMYGTVSLDTAQVNGKPSAHGDFEAGMERERVQRAFRRKHNFDRYRCAGLM